MKSLPPELEAIALLIGRALAGDASSAEALLAALRSETK